MSKKLNWECILLHMCPTCGDSLHVRPDSDVYECMQADECNFFIGIEKLKALQKKIAMQELRK